jgi:hypothetical protein
MDPNGAEWKTFDANFASNRSAIRKTMMKLYAWATKIWSAETPLRFRGFGDLSLKQGRVQRPAKTNGRLARV